MIINWYKQAQSAGGGGPPPASPPPGLPPLPPPPGVPGAGPGAPLPSESRVGTISGVHKGRIKGGHKFDKDVINWLDKHFKDFYEEYGEDNETIDDKDLGESPRMRIARTRTVQLAKAAPPEGLGLDVGGPECLSIAMSIDEKYPDKKPPFVRGILCPESSASASPAGGSTPPPPMM